MQQTRLISHKPLNFTYVNQTLKLNTLSRPNKEFTGGIQPAAGGTQPSEALQPLRAPRSALVSPHAPTSGARRHPAQPRTLPARKPPAPPGTASPSHAIQRPEGGFTPQPEQRPNGRTARARCPLNGRLRLPPPPAVPEPRAAPAGAARPL